MLKQPQTELDALLGRGMFEHVPFNVAVIDRNFQLVAANQNFKEFFGDWPGRRCYEVYKNSTEPCSSCHARATFEDGQVRVSDETGIDRNGRTCHYVVHLAPLRDDEGQVKYIIEMTTDLTETRHWQREYDLFFERVPCYVLVVDRNYRVIRANEKFRQTFGETDGKFCYQTCKRRKEPCKECPAAQTFEDGLEHVSNQVGVHQDGSPAYYVVTSAPLSRGEKGVAHVIEMASDMSQIHQLESELKMARDFYDSLIRNSPAGILAVGPRGNARVMNPAARELLNWKHPQLPSAERLSQMLPEEFFSHAFEPGERVDLPETSIQPAKGTRVPVSFSAVGLKTRGGQRGRAAFMQDLREINRLEQEKLDAERLAAVGQTVAGLAHTIKNLLMGLEGGMYMMDTGLRGADVARITNGWEILNRNFQKTTTLVKDFLNFAKGRLPELQLTDPNALARDMVELYHEAAHMQGVEFELDAGAGIEPAFLDPHGMETCLTNLLSNAIDAAAMSGKPDGKVVLRTREDDGELVFEVIDNGCGMDWEVKGKVFTTFFTTKGGKGTGLGLLTTRKIVQEHGGRIEVESTPGMGSTFRIRLPRKRLQIIADSAALAAASPDRGKP
jgi:PAS domain S-box-containing protein